MNITAHEITADIFDDMLCILPPAARDGKGFLLGEAYAHNENGRPVFMAFFNISDRFYKCDQVLTVKQYLSLKPSDITTT